MKAAIVEKQQAQQKLRVLSQQEYEKTKLKAEVEELRKHADARKKQQRLANSSSDTRYHEQLADSYTRKIERAKKVLEDLAAKITVVEEQRKEHRLEAAADATRQLRARSASAYSLRKEGNASSSALAMLASTISSTASTDDAGGRAGDAVESRMQLAASRLTTLQQRERSLRREIDDARKMRLERQAGERNAVARQKKLETLLSEGEAKVAAEAEAEAVAAQRLQHLRAKAAEERRAFEEQLSVLQARLAMGAGGGGVSGEGGSGGAGGDRRGGVEGDHKGGTIGLVRRGSLGDASLVATAEEKERNWREYERERARAWSKRQTLQAQKSKENWRRSKARARVASAKEKAAEYEDGWRQVREATGIHDLNALIARFVEMERSAADLWAISRQVSRRRRHRTAPHHTAPHRTAPHCTAPHRSKCRPSPAFRARAAHLAGRRSLCRPLAHSLIRHGALPGCRAFPARGGGGAGGGDAR